jgi:hypothetical protein
MADIWSEVVNHFYDIASSGRRVDGGVDWGVGSLDADFESAIGRLEAYSDETGEARVFGLRGTLDGKVEGAERYFHKMELQIETREGAGTTLTVTKVDTGEQHSTQNALGVYPWYGHSDIGQITDNFGDGQFINVHRLTASLTVSWLESATR